MSEIPRSGQSRRRPGAGARRLAALAPVVWCLAAAGCSREEAAPANPAGANGGAVEADGDRAPVAQAPPLKAIDRAAFDQLLAERQGKVVLVDFWATWCQPCVVQLPHTGELARRLGERGLAVMTISLDEEAAAAAAAATVAEAAGDGADHFISALGGGPKAMEAFEIGSGAAPHYKLYDRTGKLRQVFEVDPTADRQFTPADIDAAVEALLVE
jgi:thiol-disulfide isomerase/thioredoxin